MTKRKLATFKRTSNAIAKKLDGCVSATCPFHLDDEKRIGAAMLCDCKEQLGDMARQLLRELETMK